MTSLGAESVSLGDGVCWLYLGALLPCLTGRGNLPADWTRALILLGKENLVTDQALQMLQSCHGPSSCQSNWIWNSVGGMPLGWTVIGPFVKMYCCHWCD